MYSYRSTMSKETDSGLEGNANFVTTIKWLSTLQKMVWWHSTKTVSDAPKKIRTIECWLRDWLGVSDVKDIQDLRVHYSHSGWPLATQGLEILTLHLQFHKHASRKETDGPAQVPWVEPHRNIKHHGFWYLCKQCTINQYHDNYNLLGTQSFLYRYQPIRKVTTISN